MKPAPVAKPQLNIGNVGIITLGTAPFGKEWGALAAVVRLVEGEEGVVWDRAHPISYTWDKLDRILRQGLTVVADMYGWVVDSGVVLALDGESATGVTQYGYITAPLSQTLKEDMAYAISNYKR